VGPHVNEIWYDGFDQNCDGLSDYDQDMDGHDALTFGGLDCDDLDSAVGATDDDGDGYLACVDDCNDDPNTGGADQFPGNPEVYLDGVDQDCDGVDLATSCLDYKNAGQTLDGVYTIDDGNGALIDVYCDLNTEGGGWTLFARTTSSQCAEQLPFGPNELTSLSGSAYVSLLTGDFENTEFMQDFRADGVNTDFTLIYDFGNTDTVENRFLSQQSVTWIINEGAESYSGNWWYTNNLGSSPWSRGSGSDFSNDDGQWGAGYNGYNVDGNGGNSVVWGHGNQNSGDSQCSGYRIDGSSSSSSNIISLMYFR